jgi:hypothetical protein
VPANRPEAQELTVKKFIAVLVAALATAVLAAPAQAAAVSYKGKTRGGNTITFKRSGSKITRMTTMVPVVCLSTRGAPRAGADLFTPSGSITLGRTQTSEALQKTGLYYSKVTKHYKVSTKLGRQGAITGKLHMSLSYAYPVIDYWSSYLVIYICSGDSTFSAKPR